MSITKKNLLIIGFLFIFAVCFALLGVEAEASNVDFETFINSVKAGEFVLGSSVEDKLMDAIEAGDKDTAMDIYRDYFDMDDDSDDADDEKCESAEADDSEDVVENEDIDIIETAAETEEVAEQVSAESEVVTENIEAETADAETVAVEVNDTADNVQIENEVVSTDATVSDISNLGISDADYSILCRIVEAEAPNEGEQGKLLVANVVLNRVASPSYPSTISGVVSQPGQFGPHRTGKINRVVPTAETIAAVNRALSGENAAPNVVSFRSARASANWGGKIFAFTYRNHNFYY